jgi:nicotinate-nucleotide adenylyltransferase
MKIGLFFGSFNPIHTGHLLIAQYICNFYADKVWFIISPQNPLKQKVELLDVGNRLDLLKTAISKNEKFELSEIELNLPLPSYTIDTLRTLEKLFPEHDFYLIMGSDNFVNITTWKSFDILLRDYKFLIYQRPEFEIDPNITNPNVTILQAPLINISSTQIRELIAAGKSVRYLLPDAVLEIIRNKQFYLHVIKNKTQE